MIFFPCVFLIGFFLHVFGHSISDRKVRLRSKALGRTDQKCHRWAIIFTSLAGFTLSVEKCKQWWYGKFKPWRLPYAKKSATSSFHRDGVFPQNVMCASNSALLLNSAAHRPHCHVQTSPELFIPNNNHPCTLKDFETIPCQFVGYVKLKRCQIFWLKSQ